MTQRRGLMPSYIEPCLPSLAQKAPTGDGWIFEIKHDGYRLAVRIEGGRVRLLTRCGLDWTDSFPTVREGAEKLLAKSAYLDGEVVVEDSEGRSDWSSLHRCAARRSCPEAVFFAFGLLFLDGRDLRSLPLMERKAMLFAMDLGGHHGIRLTEHLQEDGAAIFARACDLGLEGIVAKRAESADSDASRPGIPI